MTSIHRFSRLDHHHHHHHPRSNSSNALFDSQVLRLDGLIEPLQTDDRELFYLQQEINPSPPPPPPPPIRLNAYSPHPSSSYFHHSLHYPHQSQLQPLEPIIPFSPISYLPPPPPPTPSTFYDQSFYNHQSSTTDVDPSISRLHLQSLAGFIPSTPSTSPSPSLTKTDVHQNTNYRHQVQIPNSKPIIKAESKKEKIKKHSSLLNRVCDNCQAITTPEWRSGPNGRGTLCNACGLRYRKSKAGRANRDWIWSTTTNNNPNHHNNINININNNNNNNINNNNNNNNNNNVNNNSITGLPTSHSFQDDHKFDQRESKVE